MPKVPRSDLQTFQNKWASWQAPAQQLNIPFKDFQSIAKLDWNRLANGEGVYSQSQAFSEMQSLAAGKPITPLPTTSYNPFTAAMTDVQGIFQGLYHLGVNQAGLLHPLTPGTNQTLLKDAWDIISDPAGSITHGIIDPLAGNPNTSKGASTLLNSPWAYVPGVADLAELQDPALGYHYLLQHPVSSLLDILPAIGKLFDVGEAGAARAGLTESTDPLTGDLTKTPLGRFLAYTTQPHPFTTTLQHLYTGLIMDPETNLPYDSLSTIHRLGSRLGSTSTAIRDTLEHFLPSHLAREWFLRTPNRFTTAFKNALNPLLQRTSEVSASLTTEDMAQLQRAIYGQYPGLSKAQLVGPIDPDGNLLPDPSNSSPLNPRVRAAYAFSLNLARRVEDSNVELGLGDHLQHPTEPRNEYVSFSSPLHALIARYSNLTDRLTALSGDLSSTHAKLALSTSYTSDPHYELPFSSYMGPAGTPVSMPDLLRAYAEHIRSRIDNNDTSLYTDPSRTSPSTVASLMYQTNVGGSIFKLAGNLASHAYDDGLSRIRYLLRTVLKNPAFNLTDSDLSNLRNHLETAESLLTEHRDLTNPISKTALPKLTATVAHLERLQSQLLARINHLWPTDAMSRFDGPLFRDAIKPIMTKLLQSKLTSGELTPLSEADISRAFAAISEQAFLDPSFVRVFSPSDWYKARLEALKTLKTLQDAGHDPLYIPHVFPQELKSIEHPHFATDKIVTPDASYGRTFNISDSMFDPLIGLTKGAMQILRHQYQTELRTIIEKSPFIIPHSSFYTLALRAWQATHPSDTITIDSVGGDSPIVNAYARTMGYVRYNGDTIFGGDKRVTPFSKAAREGDFIRSVHANLLTKTIRGGLDTMATRAWDRYMGAYRIGILGLSLRFGAHIIAGGSLLLFLTDILDHPIDTLLQLKNAYRMASDPDALNNLGMKPGYGEQGLSKSLGRPELAINFKIGHSALGRWWHELSQSKMGNAVSTIGGIPIAYTHLLHFVSDFQRSLSYLIGSSAEDRLLQSGAESTLTPQERAYASANGWSFAEYAGVKTATRTMVDLHTLAPSERALIRFAIPFYAWTRHLIQYILRFPSDHPMRAAFLTVAANQALGADANLPQYLYRLLFIGSPDASSNVEVDDYRAWNPFRDAANYMTWAGWITQLNPLAQTLISQLSPTAAGLLSASTDPYSNLQYDSFYNTNTPVPPSNIFSTLLDTTSPQANLIANLTNSNSYLSYLKTNDPSKFPYAAWDALGVPWVPYTLNLNDVTATAEGDRYNNAKSAAKAALSSNNPAPIAGYTGFLPVDGFQISVGEIRNFITQANAINAQSSQPIPAWDLLNLGYPQSLPTYITTQGEYTQQ